jgi:hypothetical protein
MDKMTITTGAPCHKFTGGGLELERSNVHAADNNLSNSHECFSV